MTPYLDFGQRPACAVRSEGEMVYYEDEGLVFASAADWLRLFRAFVEHIARRYGRENAAGWVYDLTQDIRTPIPTFCKDEAEL